MGNLLIPLVLASLIGGVCSGLLAYARNRDHVLWTILGAVLLGVPLIFLLAASGLCPNCKMPIPRRFHKEHLCPYCDKEF